MLALAIVAVLGASVAAVPPAPTRWVEDQAGLMSSASRVALDGRLERYERASGHQIVVWIGDTLDGAPLDDWAVRTFAAWKVGRQGHDDGVAMFVLAKDRAIDIEVGYGLEGQVPDAVASRIIGDVMVPRLRASDPDGAITAGVDALLTAIEGHPVTDAATPAAAVPPTSGGLSTVQIVLGILAILGLLGLAITHPRLALMMLWTLTSGGRGRGGGFGGGGGLSGGGGFSGGGGRSGGGGARGSW